MPETRSTCCRSWYCTRIKEEYICTDATSAPGILLQAETLLFDPPRQCHIFHHFSSIACTQAQFLPPSLHRAGLSFENVEGAIGVSLLQCRNDLQGLIR